MADQGLASDFKVYQEQFFGGFNETLQQMSNAFNEASRGCLTLGSEVLGGDYEQESFFESVSNLVKRRDPTSVATSTPTKLTQDEFIRVKVHRAIHNENVGDAFRKIKKSPEEMSMIVGEQAAKATAVEMLNSVIRSLKAAIVNNAGTTYDATALASNTQITHRNLNNALRKFGDALDRISLWVMHSHSYFDLVEQSIVDNVFEIAGMAIKQGTPATLGKPVLVTDSPALYLDTTRDAYTVLGLTAGAGAVVESENRDFLFEKVGGLANIVYRYQLEYAFNLGVKGYKWDTTSGGANPDDTALALGTNWDKVVNDDKLTAGVALVHHAREDAIAS